MSTPRENDTATLLADGDVLVTGGRASLDAGVLSSSELYDPTTNHWSPAGSLVTARAGQTATLLSDGEVLVTGGLDAGANTLSSAELYDPTTKAWTGTASMSVPRSDDTATLLANGRVLVVGGSIPINSGAADLTSTTNSAELYDPISRTWSAAGKMSVQPGSRHGHLVGRRPGARRRRVR